MVLIGGPLLVFPNRLQSLKPVLNISILRLLQCHIEYHVRSHVTIKATEKFRTWFCWIPIFCRKSGTTLLHCQTKQVLEATWKLFVPCWVWCFYEEVWAFKHLWIINFYDPPLLLHTPKDSHDKIWLVNITGLHGCCSKGRVSAIGSMGLVFLPIHVPYKNQPFMHR